MEKTAHVMEARMMRLSFHNFQNIGWRPRTISPSRESGIPHPTMRDSVEEDPNNAPSPS